MSIKEKRTNDISSNKQGEFSPRPLLIHYGRTDSGAFHAHFGSLTDPQGKALVVFERVIMAGELFPIEWKLDGSTLLTATYKFLPTQMREGTPDLIKYTLQHVSERLRRYVKSEKLSIQLAGGGQ